MQFGFDQKRLAQYDTRELAEKGKPEDGEWVYIIRYSYASKKYVIAVISGESNLVGYLYS